MAAVTICSDFGAPQNKLSHCFHCFPIYLPWSDGTGLAPILFSYLWLFPWTSQVVPVIKNPPANAGNIRDVSLTHGLGRSPGEGHGNPLQYSCLENPMERSLGLQRIRHGWSNLAYMHISCQLRSCSECKNRRDSVLLFRHKQMVVQPVSQILTLEYGPCSDLG